MRLASIHLYPVKSLRGVDVTTAAVEPWGLRHDRRWLLLNPDGTYLTAREEHRMLGVGAMPRDGGAVAVTGLDGTTLEVKEPVDGEFAPTATSRLDTVRLAAPEAHEWFSAQFGRPLRLGWLDDPRRRSVSEQHGGLPGDIVNLSDVGPLLLTTTASLRQLNDWIAEGAVARGEEMPEPLPMSRFRPSVVVDAARVAFAEDGWKQVRIGEVVFRVFGTCDRCVLTTIDAQTYRTGKEPIRTLSRHRKWDGKVYFGVWLVPQGEGTISVGDEVTGTA